ncbi:MAG TPA: 4-hydroxy-3-methylbut-2-enyl diphosphate reductase [Synergistaceae bacterium]|nr:4-hydroxy-3-methylbut-2-enyl diphosphate reductase [Synergistaceae bacterium]HPQ36938.1 4-hydroxy-3-methylbut-2-enyl diphosphate reductase [Synergistaceae bacterium]
MKCIMADPTGLCFGVRRAIDQLEEALEEHCRVYALGSPIHNPQEVGRLEKKGLEVVQSPQEVPEGGVVFIRAHGVPPEDLELLRGRRAHLVDGTCPFVRKAQEQARRLSQEGYFVVIVGDTDHPEVKGIRGHVEGNVTVINPALPVYTDFPPASRVGVVCQTTLREESLIKIVSHLLIRTEELRVCNTICRATVLRQDSVKKLSREVDGIIVMGGKNSANTHKLVQIVQNSGTPVQWIEQAEDLDWRWVEGKNTLGIAAGASTPDWLIHELHHILESSRLSKGMDG